jgi:hypothetical protein
MNPATANHAIRLGAITCRHISTAITAYNPHTPHANTTFDPVTDTDGSNANVSPSATLNNPNPSSTNRKIARANSRIGGN